MYKSIEEIYKKESPYNKVKKKTFYMYILAVPFLLVFSNNKNYFMMILTIIVVVLRMKKIYEKVLKEKLYFNFNIKDKTKMPLDIIMREKEKILFINYLKSNSLYKKETIMVFLEHYRCFIKTKIIGGNFLSILSIVISILLAFVTKDGFDMESFETSIPYLVSLIFLFIIVYLPISRIAEIKKFFNGEDGMIERLECIFSELYVEYDKKIMPQNNIKSKKNSKKNRRKNKLKTQKICIF